jgi:hypothetical protein
VAQQKYFSNPNLVIFSFPTPFMKLKLRLQIGGRLLMANHLDQSLWLTNEKHRATRISYSLGSPVPFMSLNILWKKGTTFFHPFLFCWAAYWAQVKLFYRAEKIFPIYLTGGLYCRMVNFRVLSESTPVEGSLLIIPKKWGNF